MLVNLPVEIILLICEYPESKDLGQLAWTNKRMMQIIKKYLPMALERKTLLYLYYQNNDEDEERIGLFNSYTCSVEEIAKFNNYYAPYEVATTQDKIFGINGEDKSFEIFDLNTRQILKGPDPPEWRNYASVAYFKDKLYYLGGEDPKISWKATNRVDVLIDGKWETGPAFPLLIGCVQTLAYDEILYVIDGREIYGSRKIYRLSGDEQEWIEIGEISEQRGSCGVASLNGRIYITGGLSSPNTFKSCLCFDPSAPVGRRISQIADLNYERHHHSLVVANKKLYAIGGFQKVYHGINFCNSIEEYDPQTNKWREVGKINSHEVLFYLFYRNNDKSEGRICLFNPFTCSVEGIAKLWNFYEPYLVATTQNKIFGINSEKKSFEIYDLITRQISRGSVLPKWHDGASVAYFKDKLYYLGGKDPKAWIRKITNRVDVLIDGKWQKGPALPLPIRCAQAITCDGILYVIDGENSRKIYRLSDDERKWIKVGEIPEIRISFGVASLNGRIYVTGGVNDGKVFKSCLCLDPSAPVDSRISQVVDMSYARYRHSLIVASGKLYTIGGFQNTEKTSDGSCLPINFCDAIEEYNPQTNKWREVGKLT